VPLGRYAGGNPVDEMIARDENEEPKATTDKIEHLVGTEVIVKVFEWASEHIGEVISEVSEAAGAVYSHIGKFIGPTITIVHGAEIGAEGIHNVLQYKQNKIEPLEDYTSTGEILERPAPRGR
jgi:hypothetical protein